MASESTPPAPAMAPETKAPMTPHIPVPIGTWPALDVGPIPDDEEVAPLCQGDTAVEATNRKRKEIN
ncbi:hypothetical protein BS47DRAFT_902099 [Hydnum rufescens UP504]|uniref:Uncharacterized protein n=1 Tax=Hydnum rufescens UP504 TaxID=1448309 RepID=A0A9P6DEG2_9AGAM|nr:hypothetical protein BS47DRAFT_902099 [Hydnum rufescens UP504]